MTEEGVAIENVKQDTIITLPHIATIEQTDTQPLGPEKRRFPGSKDVFPFNYYQHQITETAMSSMWADLTKPSTQALMTKGLMYTDGVVVWASEPNQAINHVYLIGIEPNKEPAVLFSITPDESDDASAMTAIQVMTADVTNSDYIKTLTDYFDRSIPSHKEKINLDLMLTYSPDEDYTFKGSLEKYHTEKEKKLPAPSATTAKSASR